MKTTKTVPIIFLAVAAGGAALFYYNSSQSVGQVGNTKLPKSQFQQKLKQANTFYQYSKTNPDQATMEKATLENMINDALIRDYAREKNITVSDKEMGDRYLQVVAGYNRNHNLAGGSDAAFLAQIRKMYGLDKNGYLEEIRLDILKEKIQDLTQMPLSKWLETEKKSVDIKK